ncbi:F0F1 ATP synthase subunit gamma [Patescibacteria group bacterium]|nr:F0F1 ATP synthase subunit gamma [Patescibacteria group bacterium]
MKQTSSRSLKRKIKSLASFQKMTRSISLTAAVKLRRVQMKMLKARFLGYELLLFLKELLKRNNNLPNHYLFNQAAADRADLAKKILVIVIASDRGLAGSFDLNIFRQAESIIADLDKSQFDLGLIGRKAKNHFKKRGFEPIFAFEHFENVITKSDITELIEFLKRALIKNIYSRVAVIYNNFYSVLKQKVEVVDLYPFSFETFDRQLENIIPRQGMFSDQTKVKPAVGRFEYLIEPSPEKVLPTVLELAFSYLIYLIILEANSAEQAARLITMQRAFENASEMMFETKLVYNKLRQGQITRELLEIISGSSQLINDLV